MTVSMSCSSKDDILLAMKTQQSSKYFNLVFRFFKLIKLLIVSRYEHFTKIYHWILEPVQSSYQEIVLNRSGKLAQPQTLNAISPKITFSHPLSLNNWYYFCIFSALYWTENRQNAVGIYTYIITEIAAHTRPVINTSGHWRCGHCEQGKGQFGYELFLV